MFYLTQKAQIIAADSMDVIAENTSRYIAETGQNADCIATILDAKKNLFYAAVFDRVDGIWQKCFDTQIVTADKLLKWLQENKKQNVGLLGEGLVYYAEKFDAPFTYFLDKSYWSATAGGLYRVGQRMAAEDQFADPYMLTPKYVREPDAIVKSLLQRN
jgi:tRNA A37 threonylcarbamoyladenosine modification protein TsaB